MKKTILLTTLLGTMMLASTSFATTFISKPQWQNITTSEPQAKDDCAISMIGRGIPNGYLVYKNDEHSVAITTGDDSHPTIFDAILFDNNTSATVYLTLNNPEGTAIMTAQYRLLDTKFTPSSKQGVFIVHLTSNLSAAQGGRHLECENDVIFTPAS